MSSTHKQPSTPNNFSDIRSKSSLSNFLEAIHEDEESVTESESEAEDDDQKCTPTSSPYHHLSISVKKSLVLDGLVTNIHIYSMASANLLDEDKDDKNRYDWLLNQYILLGLANGTAALISLYEPGDIPPNYFTSSSSFSYSASVYTAAPPILLPGSLSHGSVQSITTAAISNRNYEEIVNIHNIII